MELLGIRRLSSEHKEIMLPLIAKTEGDRKRLLLKQAFESIVRMANRYADELTGAAKEAETKAPAPPSLPGLFDVPGPAEPAPEAPAPNAVASSIEVEEESELLAEIAEDEQGDSAEEAA
jgi:hypothetical protein